MSPTYSFPSLPCRGEGSFFGVPTSFKTVHRTVLNSPLAEGFSRLVSLVSLASQATKGAAFGIRQGLCPMHHAAFEKAGETFLTLDFHGFRFDSDYILS